MTEINFVKQWFSLTAPRTVGEHPPMEENPKALVLFFDTPEQCAAWEKFLGALATWEELCERARETGDYTEYLKAIGTSAPTAYAQQAVAASRKDAAA